MKNNDEQLNNDLEQPQQTESFADVIDEPKSEDTPSTETAVKRKHSKAEIVINVALWVAIVVLLVMVILRLFVFSTVEVDGASMNPTYEDKEIVTVNKAILPNRGDVIVFYKNEVENKFLAQFAKREECLPGQPYEKLIKRVVALENDKIWVQRVTNDGDDVIYEVVIDTDDGHRLFEDYYVKKGEVLNRERYYIHSNKGSDLGNLTDCTEENPFVVSEGCFFAMGDNRINSNDSRVFGEFKLTQIFGVVLDK